MYDKLFTIVIIFIVSIFIFVLLVKKANEGTNLHNSTLTTMVLFSKSIFLIMRLIKVYHVTQQVSPSRWHANFTKRGNQIHVGHLNRKFFGLPFQRIPVMTRGSYRQRIKNPNMTISIEVQFTGWYPHSRLQENPHTQFRNVLIVHIVIKKSLMFRLH